MHKQNEGLWEWSVFWHSNQLHSCMPLDHDSDVLAPVWKDFFNALPGGASILDMGTGNGSLAAQAVVVSRSKSPPFSIHGADLADIDPSHYVASAEKLLREVEFHPRTAMENLPFDAQSFDAVGSQYAIEYSNVPESLCEMNRVLKPGGQVRLLLHANSGVLRERCNLQYGQAQSIMASELFSATEALLGALIQAETQNSHSAIHKAEALILRVKNVFDALELKFSEDEDRSLVDNLFAAVRSLPNLRKSYPLHALIKMSEDIQLLLRAQSKRLLAMQQAALDDAEVNEMLDQLRSMKFECLSVKTANTATGERCLGYWLSATKPLAVMGGSR